MMHGTTISVTTNGWGCPYYGCTCMGGTGCSPFGGNQFMIVMDDSSYRSRRQAEIEAMLVQLKTEISGSKPSLSDHKREMLCQH